MINYLKDIKKETLIGLLPDIINSNNESIRNEFNWIFDSSLNRLTKSVYAPTGSVKAHFGEFVNLACEYITVKNADSLKTSILSAVESVIADSFDPSTKQLTNHNILNHRFINSEFEESNYMHDADAIVYKTENNEYVTVKSALDTINPEEINRTLTILRTDVNLNTANINNASSQINVINTSVNKLSTSVNSINTSINSINTIVNKNTNDIANVSTRTASNIETLNSSVGTINSSVRNINSSISAINDSINSINDSVGSINNSITSINASISNISTAISNIKGIPYETYSGAMDLTISPNIYYAWTPKDDGDIEIIKANINSDPTYLEEYRIRVICGEWIEHIIFSGWDGLIWENEDDPTQDTANKIFEFTIIDNYASYKKYNRSIPPVLKYTVTYNANGGSNPPIDTSTYEQGEEVIVKKPIDMIPPTGKRFSYWTDQNGDRFDPNEVYTMPGNNVTFTAHYINLRYTITYDLNGGSGTTPTEGSKIAGSTFTLHNGIDGIIPPSDDMAFSCWEDLDGSTFAGGQSYTMPAKNVTLDALWAAKPEPEPEIDLLFDGLDIFEVRQTADINLSGTYPTYVNTVDDADYFVDNVPHFHILNDNAYMFIPYTGPTEEEPDKDIDHKIIISKETEIFNVSTGYDYRSASPLYNNDFACDVYYFEFVSTAKLYWVDGYHLLNNEIFTGYIIKFIENGDWTVSDTITSRDYTFNISPAKYAHITWVGFAMGQEDGNLYKLKDGVNDCYLPIINSTNIDFIRYRYTEDISSPNVNIILTNSSEEPTGTIITDTGDLVLHLSYTLTGFEDFDNIIKEQCMHYINGDIAGEEELIDNISTNLQDAPSFADSSNYVKPERIEYLVNNIIYPYFDNWYSSEIGNPGNTMIFESGTVDKGKEYNERNGQIFTDAEIIEYPHQPVIFAEDLAQDKVPCLYPGKLFMRLSYVLCGDFGIRGDKDNLYIDLCYVDDGTGLPEGIYNPGIRVNIQDYIVE